MIRLTVLEAYPRDVGLGVARIDYDTMNRLNVISGDTIAFQGKRETVAKCLPLFPTDQGKGIITIDGLKRNNSGIMIGDDIVVRKVRAIKAQKVIVTPMEIIPPIDERYLADALDSVHLVKGDHVMVRYLNRGLIFCVIDVTPDAEAVWISRNTIFQNTGKSSCNETIVTNDSSTKWSNRFD